MFLNCHSWFSFQYGLMSPEELLRQAQANGVRTIALTDIHNTGGVLDFVRLAPRFDVRPVVGIEFRQGARLLYIGVAKNNAGFQQLNELLSPHLLDGEAIPEHAPARPDVFFILPFNTAPRILHPNERIGIKPSDLTRLPLSPWAKRPKDLVALLPVTFRDPGPRPGRDFNTHRLLRTMAKNTVVSMLPAEELGSLDDRFRSDEEVRQIYRDHPYLIRNAEQLLEECAIDFEYGTDKTRKVFGSSEALDRERLRADAYAGMLRRYRTPSPTVLARIEKELAVVERMGFVSYFLINQDLVQFARSKGFFHVGRGSGANSLVAYCLGITDVDPIELDLYFERFISTARKKPPDFDIDFSWKDRDEVIAYLFKKYGERHVAQLATYTTFQWRGAVRELGKAMGLPPAEIDALSEGDTGHYGRGRMSSGVRTGDIDQVAQAVVRYAQHLLNMPHHFGIHVGGMLVSELPMTYYTSLHRPPKGFPVTQFSMLEAEDIGLHKFDILSQRGLGHIRDAVELVNAGSEDQTIRRSENGNAGRSADGNAAASHEPRATSLAVRAERAAGIDIHNIPAFKEDPAIKELLRTGNTIGCFYVESPAMRMLLKKLQVEDYPTLVAASSIIRPGVAESGMMREYILRHNDPERRKQAPRTLYNIMPDTYGVMVYQEDVIKVAHHYAGLTLDEADTLRRGMTSRFRERPEFAAVREKYFNGCRAKGHPDAEAQEVWRQIESFASFSFAKGHSASYAVESYQSLYLKAHHPLEFMVGVANNFGGFYNTEFYLHEAKRAGATIEAPCLNASEELCLLSRSEDQMIRRSEDGGSANEVMSHEPRATSLTGIKLVARGSKLEALSSTNKPYIYLGLANIKSLNNETVQLILHERRHRGPFADLPDLLRRVPLHVEQARILIRVGALRFTGRSKPQLLWDLTLLHRPSSADPHGDLFITKVEEPKLPDLQHYPLADAYDELDLLGFPLCDPFSLVELGSDDQMIRRSENGNADPVNSQHANTSTRNILARQMISCVGKKVEMLGYMIHVKTTTTNSGSYMSFGSFIDTVGDFWDSTQFPSVAAQYPFRGRGVYRFTGIVEAEFGHCSLRAQTIEKLPWRPDPRYGEK